MGGTNMDPKQMDAEIAVLFAKIPGQGDNTYPNHELRVANEFIRQHPEFEKSRTEVYVSYVRVYEQMKKGGKLATPDSGPLSLLVRPKPPSKTTVNDPKAPSPQAANLPLPPEYPALNTSMESTWYIFLGVDPLPMIRNLTEPSEKPEQAFLRLQTLLIAAKRLFTWETFISTDPIQTMRNFMGPSAPLVTQGPSKNR
jgi:hypothetical protein